MLDNSTDVKEGITPAFANTNSLFSRKLRILLVPANAGGICLRLLPLYTAWKCARKRTFRSSRMQNQ